MGNFISITENKITIFLSHRPKLYALVVGIGIILFWRGVWHSVDYVFTYFNYYNGPSSIDDVLSPWWDAPLSFMVGSMLLYFSGAFISSFIGNEIILAGLRGEKQLARKC